MKKILLFLLSLALGLDALAQQSTVKNHYQVLDYAQALNTNYDLQENGIYVTKVIANPEMVGTGMNGALIHEAFEEYTVGNKITEAANASGNDWWTTWNNIPGSSEDGVVAMQGSSKCGFISRYNNQVLLFGGMDIGDYDLEFDILVPEGKNGYFSILHHFNESGSILAMQCYLHMINDSQTTTSISGHGTIHAGSTVTADIPAVYDEWMHFRLQVNTDNDLAAFYYSSETTHPTEQKLCEWQWSLDSYGNNIVGSSLDAMNFISLLSNGTSQFYIDNFILTQNDGEITSATITASANPTDGGTVNGGGYFTEGQTCTLTATANAGYTFTNWMENGTVVSTENPYTFTVMGSRNLVANFTEGASALLFEDFNDGLGVFTAYDVIGEQSWHQGSYQNVTYANMNGFSVGYGYKQNEDWLISPAINKTGFSNVFIEFRTAMKFDGDPLRVKISSNYDGQGNPNNFEWQDITDAFNFSTGDYEWVVSGNVEVVISANVFYLAFVYTSNTTAATSWEIDYVKVEASGSSVINYDITVSAAPAEGGTVTGGGNYSAGSSCTLTATANAGYTFTNWTENGVVVSTENPYTFTVTENRNLVANFIEVTDEDYWEVDAHAYAGTMSVNAIIQIDGVEQFRTDLEIGAFSGDECRGTMRPTDEYYYPDEMPHYFVFLTVHGDNGDPITFRLYDHSLHQELDLTCANTLTFSDNATIGDFDEPYAINFRNAITQTTDFRTGWNWWSSYVELDDIEGLAMLEEGLGEAGVQIKSQSKFAINYGSTWLGGLNAITNEQTLKVQVNAPVLVDLTGKPVSPADHPLTLNAGWNWIGYPSTNSLSVAEAFSNYTPVAGDQVKTQFSYAIYRPNIGWMGALRTINPGDGLFFYSTNGGTLIFPEGTRGSELADNLTADHNHWVPDMNAYQSNMTVMAVVELEDVELQSERYELAAFANGEVHGSARLMYIEPMDRYMAFLTVTGDEAADLHFGLYDTETGAECLESDDLLVFTADVMVGELESPMVVSFRGTTGLSDLERCLQVYPNPVNRGERAILTLPINAKAQIEVVNALGVVVETSRATSVQAPASPGVYTLRITVDGKGTYSRKLVVK